MNKWDSKYASAGYFYGTRANEFLVQELDRLSLPPLSTVLLPAEGEGRNLLHVQQRGLKPLAYDFSEVGRRKALELVPGADYRISDHLAFWRGQVPHFDAAAWIYAHAPSEERREIFAQCARKLPQGGVMLAEGFAPEQLGRTSGGPKEQDLFYRLEDFEALRALGLLVQKLEKCEIQLNEGSGHHGAAWVVRYVGVKTI